MKLRLPHRFQAALLAALASVSFTTLSTGTLTVATGAALLAGQQAQAGDRTTEQLTEATTTVGDVTYNGYVFTMINGSGNFSGRTFQQVEYNEQGQWVNVGNPITSGNKDVSTPLGTGYFWRMYCSAAGLDHAPDFGTTLRFAGATNQQKVVTDFSDFTIGGLIAEGDKSDASAGLNATYWLCRNASMDINGLHDVNMDINAHVTFSYQTSINLKKGGTWNIHEGKTLTFNNNSSGVATSFIFYENQALIVKGGGTLVLDTKSSASGDSVNMRAGSSLTVTGTGTTVNLGNSSAGINTINGTITVETGSILNINANTTLGRTITNAGTLNVASGKTVTLTSDLSGFDYEAAFTDYETGTTGKGFTGNKNYIIINNTDGGSCALTQVTYNGQTKNLVNGRMLIEGATDYSTYYIQADNASMDLAQAITYAQGQSGNLTTVNVQGTGATITVGSNQSLNTLNILGGKSATVSGTGTLTLANLSLGAGSTLGLGENAHVTITSKPTLSGRNITLATGSVLDLSGLTLNAALFGDIAGSVTGVGTVKLGTAQEIAFSGNQTTNLGTNVEIAGGIKFNGHGYDSNGHTLNLGNGTGTVAGVKVNGDLRVESKMYVNVKAGSSLTATGNLIMGHTTPPNPGFLDVNGGTLSVGHIQIWNNATANSITLANSTLVATQAGALFTYNGSGNTGTATTVSATDVTLKSTGVDWAWNRGITFGGTLTVAAGSNTITLGAAGADFRVGEAIELTSGTVAFAGNWEIGDISHTSTTQYTGGKVEGTNGFASSNAEVQLVSITSGSIGDVSGAHFTVGGVSATLDKSTGVAKTSGEPDYSTFHVMTGSENVSQGRLESRNPVYSLANGATLVVDADLNGSQLTRESGSTGNATLNIKSGKTYTSDGNEKHVTITGSGTYALTSGTITLPSHVSLGTAGEWTGAVRVSNYGSSSTCLDSGIRDLNLPAGSRVDLNGVNGYFNGNDAGQQVQQNIVLTNTANGGAAVEVTNGNSGKKVVFTGTWSGEGDFLHSWGNASGSGDQTYSFQGDISAWEGSFIAGVNASGLGKGNITLEILGAAQTVNADIRNERPTTMTLNITNSNVVTVNGNIIRSNGTLDVNVAANTTFTGELVGLSKMTVNSGFTATIQNTAEIGTLSGAGNVAVGTATGSLSLAGSDSFTGNVTVGDGSTLSLLQENSLVTTGALTFVSGSTLDLSHYRGTLSSTPVTVATAGTISGFGTGMYIAPTAPKGMEAAVTLNNNKIQVSYAAKQGSTMHLYILTGQSNSLGAVKDSPLNASMLTAYQSEGLLFNGNMNKDSGVRFETDPTWQIVAPQKPDGSGYNNNPCMGPEYGFSYIMENKDWGAQLLGEDGTLAVVKGSLDGGGNGCWLQDANAYKSLLGSVKESIQDAVALGYSNISLDGLMYLQGESNGASEASQAATRFTNFIGYLKSDLQSWLTENPQLTGITLSFDGNTVTGEPRLGTDARQTTEGQFLELATSNDMINADKNGKGHVLTNDLAVTNCDGLNVHYTGNSQLTIGARYAYAFAVQKGVNVGAVRGQDDSKTLDQAGAWWMEKLPGADEVATWDISSVSTVNNIADGQTLTVGGIKIDEVYSATATAQGQGSIAINGGAVSLGQHGINLVGADLSISSAVNAVANQTWSAQNGHKLAVNGTTTISEGATLSFADDLYLTFGAITGTGNLEIGTVTFDMGLDYMMANGMGEYVSSAGKGDNGFFTGNLNLVKLEGDNSQITFTGSGSIANITKAGDLANYNLALSSDNKALQLTGLQPPESTTYYARRGAVEYTASDAGPNGIYTAQKVALAGSATDPATLTLSTALQSGVTIKSEGLGGTINIASGIELAQGSVNASDAPVVLAGEGTFVMTPKSGDATTWPMPANMSLATGENGWKGVVRISGGNFQANNLDDLANGQYSTVELNGVSGWTGYSAGTLALNLKLTDMQDGTAAWNFNAGKSGGGYDNPKMTFTGKISGDGTLKKTNANDQSFAFAGDISKWTGAFDLTVGTKSRLTFQGNAHEVNIAVRKSNANGQISIAVGDGSNAFSTTFTEQSSIQGLDELLVRANASAEFAGGLTTASTTLNAGSTLTITGSGKTYNLGTVNTGTGTLDLVTSVSTGKMTVAAGSTLKLAGAGEGLLTVGGALTLQAGSTLDLARIFASPVQSAPVFSAVGGEIVAPANGNTYILATANSIGSLDGVELANIAKGYTGSLSTQDAGGNKQLILTLAAVTEEFIWNGGDGTWDTNAQNWHKAGSQESIAFTADSGARFDSDSTDATVRVSGAIRAGSMAVDSGANVTLVTGNGNTLGATSGITVAQGGTLKLQGTGVTGTLSGSGVVVGNAIPSQANWTKEQVLGSGVMFGDDWTGTVEVSGGNSTYDAPYVVLDTINQLGTADSTVRLKGVGGYFTEVTIIPNIELVNAAVGSPAVLITAGNNKTTTFSGTISGSGDLVFNKLGGSEETFCFTGNLSAWDGSLKTLDQAQSGKNGALTVEFAGTAQTVNASLIQGGNKRALNVKVDNVATFTNTVDVTSVELAEGAIAGFAGAVDVANVTLGSGSTATFGNTAEIGNLKGSGNLVVNSGNEEVTINGISNFAGTTTVNSGTLYLTTTVDTIGTMTVNGGTLKLSEMGTSALVNTGTLTLGSDSTLDLSTLNISGTETSPITLVKGGTITSDYLNDVTLNFRDSSLADNAHLSVSGNSLVLTFDVEGRNLEWRDPSGTWGTANKWYIAGEEERRTTFQNGDNVSIKAPYDEVQIDLFANASAGDMTMEVVGEDRYQTNVTIANKDGGEYKLEAQNLKLKEGTSLQTNVQMEVRETVQMADMTYWTINSPQNTTLAADISSTGDYHLTSISKQGDTTLVLTGDNKDYAGYIYVEDGTLAARSATALGTGEVYVENGATLSLERRRNDMTAGALTLAGGSTIAFVGDTMLTLDSLTLSDADAENRVTWDLSRYGFSDSHSAILMDGLTPFTDDFQYTLQYTHIVTPNNIHDAALSYSNGQVILSYTMDPQRTLYWVGGTGEWSTDEEVKNWLPSQYSDTPTFFKSNDNVIFDRRAASSFVTLEEEITTVGTMTVGEGTSVLLQSRVEDATLVAQEIDVQGGLSTRVNMDVQTVDIAETGTWTVLGTVDSEFHGEITGTGTLAKTGVADLQLSHDNSGFHGDINLRGGSITAADTHALGQGSTIHMENGTSIVQNPSLSKPLDMGGNTVMVDAANATATISANMKVAGGTKLTFAGDGNVNVAGTVSGGGTISQDSYGITTIQSIDGFDGTIDINHGTLALQNVYTGNASLNLGMGGTLQFAANSSGGQTATPLTLGSLSMASGSYFDVSNITLGDVTFNTVYKQQTKSTTLKNAAILAVIPGGSSDDFPHSHESSYHGTGDSDLRTIDGVTLVGTEHFGLDDSSYARLRYIYQDNNLVVYVQAAKPDGVYWNAPEPVAEWINSTTKQEPLNWNTEADGTGTRTNYDSHTGLPEENMDAYFFKKYVDGEGRPVTATITMNPETITPAGDVIFGEDTKYTINGYLLVLSGTPNDGYENKEENFASSLIVRDGAEIALNAAVTAADGTSVDVHEGGSLVITADQGVYVEGDPWESANEPVQIFSGHNAGYTQIDADGFIFKRYSNEGEMHVTHTKFFLLAPEYSVFDDFSTTIEYITNMESGVMSFSSDYLIPLPEPEDDYDPNILNDGQLYFYSPDVLGVDMFEDVPVRGRGEVYTGGEHGVIFNSILDYSPATVQASRLDLDAAFTTFNYGVDITDSTLVRAGKDANFFGGGISGNPGMVGDVGLENGLDSDHATRLVFGPQAIYVYDEDDEVYNLLGFNKTSYEAGQVMAGTDSRLTVEKGATVTMDGFNAAGFVPAGEIEVGTIHTGAESETDFTASLTIEGATAVDTITMHSGTMEVKGNANINRIMQEGGKLSLDENSTLNGLDDEAHEGALTGGTVSGGTLELKNNMVLTQNAVVDVQNGGNYTIVGAGSMIDATGLELEVEHDYILFRQIVGGEIVGKDRESAITSGFMCSGDEYVKLFDVQYEVDPSTGERVRDNDGHLVPLSTLISNDEQVYHSSASGMMTLIGNDNWESIGSSTFDVQGHIGYGYLHTSELARQTYYVRDLYTETVENPEDPTGDPLAADRVTLDDIFKASKVEDPQTHEKIEMLSNVVFDMTERNENYGPYHGTLTVNRDTSVDLFSVSAGVNAAINIIDGKTVTAAAASPGMAGNLDLEGEGVYEIENRNDLGTNIALRRDEGATAGGEWDGTVRVTGTSTDLNIDNMSVGEGSDASTIEFRNWNGALNGGEHTSYGKIVLTSTQDSPTAMKLTGEDDIAYTFTNTVTGDGNINHAEGGNVAMTFSGDTKDWEGTYEQNTSTNDSLTFSGGSEVNAGVNVAAGTMDLTYDGTVTAVNGDVRLYSSTEHPSNLNVTYNGGSPMTTPMTMSGAIETDGFSNLAITVGDGMNHAAVTFSGTFTNTDSATMTVKEDSIATIDTNASLLRVVGEEGSTVNVTADGLLNLTSTNPERTYSQFYGVENSGTIQMQAAGGDIKLIDNSAEGKTYNLGNLVLVDPAGTAAIETSGVTNGTTEVNITNLTGPKTASEILQLTNDNATGTVNYNLGGGTEFRGTIEFGSDGATGDANVVLDSNGVAANAVLKSIGTSEGTADVVVNTTNASVQGIDSATDATVGGTLYGTKEESTDPNRKVTITGDGTYSYNGGLGANLDIEYNGDGTQTFEGGADTFSGKVTVESGSNAAGVLEILNAFSVSITDLTIGANDTLNVKYGAQSAGTDGTATVSRSVVALGGPTEKGSGTASKMDGNLTLGSNASYDVSNAGGMGGLDLGGALTITQGATLSAGDIAKIYQMEIGGMYDLAFDVTMFNGSDEKRIWSATGSIGEPIDASELFGGNQFSKGEYYVCYSGAGQNGGHGGNVGTVYLYRATPEPTTSTLSLLALMALAARRRRK